MGNGQQSFGGYLDSLQSWSSGLSPNATGAVPDVNLGFAGTPPGGTPVTGATPQAGGILSTLFGSTNQQGNFVPGVGSQLLGAAGGLANTFLGYQQYKLAKDSLRENRRQFNLNFESQRTLTNSRLRDRQRARVAANPGGYESVGSYMQQNGI